MATVRVYSTPSCMYCNLLKDYLGEKEVEFEAIDVSQDDTARDMIIEKSGQMGVPVTIISSDEEGEEDTVIVGFDEEAIAGKLGIAQ